MSNLGDRPPDRIVILACEKRSALAVVRALVEENPEIRLILGSEDAHAMAFYSRFARSRAQRIVYTSPRVSIKRFITDVLGALDGHGSCLMFGMNEETMVPFLDVSESLPTTLKLAYPTHAGLRVALDKLQATRYAEEAGFRVPVTSTTDELDDFMRRVTGPFVVKPRVSRCKVGDRIQSAEVAYAATALELERLVETWTLSCAEPIVQTRILGDGYGLFFLFDRGHYVAHCAHRRLREYPLDGGPSVLRCSVALPELIVNRAIRMLERLEWHGVCMVELKGPPHDPYFLEINPRFWGSLQLAVHAGVNFPSMLYRLATGELQKSPAVRTHYTEGVSSWWLRGQIARSLELLQRRGMLVGGLQGLREMFPSRPLPDLDTFRIDDPLPFAMEMIQGFRRGVCRPRSE